MAGLRPSVGALLKSAAFSPARRAISGSLVPKPRLQGSRSAPRDRLGSGSDMRVCMLNDDTVAFDGGSDVAEEDSGRVISIGDLEKKHTFWSSPSWGQGLRHGEQETFVACVLLALWCAGSHPAPDILADRAKKMPLPPRAHQDQVYSEPLPMQTIASDDDLILAIKLKYQSASRRNNHKRKAKSEADLLVETATAGPGDQDDEEHNHPGSTDPGACGHDPTQNNDSGAPGDGDAPPDRAGEGSDNRDGEYGDVENIPSELSPVSGKDGECRNDSGCQGSHRETTDSGSGSELEDGSDSLGEYYRDRLVSQNTKLRILNRADMDMVWVAICGLPRVQIWTDAFPSPASSVKSLLVTPPGSIGPPPTEMFESAEPRISEAVKRTQAHAVIPSMIPDL